MQATENGTGDGNARPFAAVDVHYPASGGARAALVLAGDRAFSQILTEKTALVTDVAPYVPGQFYQRELPPLRAVLAGVTGIQLLVIDGYVDLAPDGRPGLGAHVHAELGVPVIGVAKTPYAAATHAVPVVRGQATRPLYVTAAGLPAADAAAIVQRMSGTFRLPDALRHVDALARGTVMPTQRTAGGLTGAGASKGPGAPSNKPFWMILAFAQNVASR
jgi:deoxyribonuclease V